jgi:hypothetical protein
MVVCTNSATAGGRNAKLMAAGNVQKLCGTDDRLTAPDEDQREPECMCGKGFDLIMLSS